MFHTCADIYLFTHTIIAIMVLDVLIRQGPSLLYPTVGRSFFTQKGSFPLSNGAEVWQGYYQSARPTKGKRSNYDKHLICDMMSSLLLTLIFILI